MRTTYDPAADVFYARFAPVSTAIAETKEVAPGVNVDLDAAGNLPGPSLPAHERMQRGGINFHNHYCPAAMCTSSRSVPRLAASRSSDRAQHGADASVPDLLCGLTDGCPMRETFNVDDRCDPFVPG
jgi:hypothetical protein